MASPSADADRKIEARTDETAQPNSSRPRPSVIGLLIVSGLNVLCLGFIAYHFAGHADEKGAELALPSRADGMTDDTNSAVTNPPVKGGTQIITNAQGNIDLVPAERFVLEIASALENADMSPADDGRGGPMTPLETAVSPMKEPSPPSASMHWVQLGALSKEATAKQYWSDLKKHHAPLLGNRNARYFSPEEVGGSLYHVRVGPMAAQEASELCDQLEAEGVDCFCIGTDKEQS